MVVHSTLPPVLLMMQKSLLSLALALLASVAGAQGVGTRLPEVHLSGFSQSSAQDFSDLSGRAVLLEFFAYW